MMKKEIYRAFFALLFVATLSACSNDDDFAPEASRSGAIELDVTATDFHTYGTTPGTRATDDGAVTTFERGDLVGLIVVDAGGNLLANNLAYKYSEQNYGSGVWSWQLEHVYQDPISKPPYFYDNSAGDLTYIVYFPFDFSVNGVKTLAELKAKFAPKPDQSSKEAYRMSDLMVWAPEPQAPLKTLPAVLAHTYTSVAYTPETRYTLVDAASTKIAVVPAGLSDVHFVHDGNAYIPYHADDGSYRYILPDNFTGGDLRLFHTSVEGKMYAATLSIPAQRQANTRYVCNTYQEGGAYSPDKARMGDLYCRDSEGKGYLLPQEATHKAKEHTCIGVVTYTGHHKDDQSDYTTSGIGQKQCHGYVMALKDNGIAAWEKGPNGEYDQAVGASTNSSDWSGYFNCRKIHEFVTANATNGWKMEHFPAANGCEKFGTTGEFTAYVAPSNSCGWFLPSAGQLSHLYNNSVLSNRFALLGKYLNTDLWYPSNSNSYWSSLEYPDYANRAYNVNFEHGSVSWFTKDYSYRRLWAVSAF